MTTEKIEAGEVEVVEVVKLQHMAVAEGGKLRWMTGRMIPYCELYAAPDFGLLREPLMTVAQHQRILAAKDAAIANRDQAFDVMNRTLNAVIDERDELRAQLADMTKNRDGWCDAARVKAELPDDARAQLAAQQAAVPDGYALVPIAVLTEAHSMLEAHSPGSGSVESYAAQDIAKAIAAPAAPQQGAVMPDVLQGAFITGESGDGKYRVVLKFETLEAMQAAHNWFARLNADRSAQAATSKAQTDEGVGFISKNILGLFTDRSAQGEKP